MRNVEITHPDTNTVRTPFHVLAHVNRRYARTHTTHYTALHYTYTHNYRIVLLQVRKQRIYYDVSTTEFQVTDTIHELEMKLTGSSVRCDKI